MGSPKESSYCQTILFISHGSKIMLKILQFRFQQYIELQNVQTGFRKSKAIQNHVVDTDG